MTIAEAMVLAAPSVEALRLFIAVELPAPVRQALGALSQRLSAHWRDGGVRWTRPDNLHLTLRFLGDTESQRVEALREMLDEVVVDHPTFELTLGPVGAFPNAERPRVVWAGFAGDGSTALRALQREVEGGIRELGWEPEARPFRPHLTLGRARPRSKPPSGDWSTHAPPGLPVPVRELLLIRSDLRPAGAEYTPLHRAHLPA